MDKNFMILGLTGAFGGGKSTVLKYFAEKKWFVFDADAACHAIYEKADAALLTDISNIFGPAAITADGGIDRKEIARQGFTDRTLLDKLTALIYPRLTSAMREAISGCRQKQIHAIFELPLLYEGGFENEFDAILAVWTSPEIRCERLKQRNFTAEDMARRDAGQLDPALKLEKADFAVINNGSTELLRSQLDALVQKWQTYSE